MSCLTCVQFIFLTKLKFSLISLSLSPNRNMLSNKKIYCYILLSAEMFFIAYFIINNSETSFMPCFKTVFSFYYFKANYQAEIFFCPVTPSFCQ